MGSIARRQAVSYTRLPSTIRLKAKTIADRPVSRGCLGKAAGKRNPDMAGEGSWYNLIMPASAETAALFDQMETFSDKSEIKS